MGKLLHGVIAVLPTPINGEEEVQVPFARRLVRYVLEAGVQGIWSLGTTGEMAMLSEKERDRMLVVVLEEFNGKVPVITGVSDNSTRRVLDQIKRVRHLGAQYVHILPPYAYPVQQEEVGKFYRFLSETSPLPFVLYNNPGITHANISIELVAELAQEERIIGMKDLSGDLRFFQSLFYNIPKESSFSLLQGSDQLVYLSKKIGGNGWVTSLAVVAPRLFRCLVDALDQGDDEQAILYQKQIVSIARSVYSCQSPIGAIKYLLNRMELCPLNITHPYQAPQPGEIVRLDATLEEIRLVN